MTAPYLGKRNLGAGTAASPGDTLYFQFAAYNDSGASIALTGLAVTDIEVIKNGSATVRATDSGYSLISDTGMVGDRIGLYRCSIQIYNTADDASFYANGAWYQAFIDAVTIDGRNVRHWLGSWELGGALDTGNIATAVWAGDTGLRDHIDNLDTGLRDTLADYDTGMRALFALRDTGAIATAVWAGDTGLRDHITNVDTGITQRLDLIRFDVDTGLRDTLADYDTGMRALLALRDTGAIATAVWAGDTGLRDHITNVDTGITQRLDVIRFDVDTGLRVHIDDSDTGLKDAIADLDTGLRGILVTTGVNVGMIRADTGAADRLLKFAGSQLKTDGTLDTGSGQTTNTLNITASATVDTGQVNNAVWNGARSAHTGAGSFGQYVHANIVAVLTDTGAAHLDAGRLGVSAAATVDTGQVNQAVWQANASRTITSLDVDTGLRELIADLDTGLRALLALRDTGAIATAVWAGDTGLRDHITNVDTGLTQRLDLIRFDVDTGLRAHIDDSDTGVKDAIADLDTGLRAILALQDTGAIATAVWAGDTGLRDHITNVDTGLTNRLAAILDTGGWVKANIRKVNNIAVTGIGDTGVGNPWRPV